MSTQEETRSAGGRARCTRWPRSELLGFKALKSAHLSSQPTVSAEVAEERARSGLVWVMLDHSAVEVHDERARVVRLEPDHLAGPAVELEEQKNAIGLAPAPLAPSHTCKRRSGGFARRGKERRFECR